MLSDNAPHRIGVYVVVGVNQDVAHTNDLRPRQADSSRSSRISDAGCRFPDFLNAVYQGAEQHPVGVQIRPCFALDEGDRVTGGVQHV